tara:strand:+ start:83 stop:583 length:501 start_codon:yes stop_codon:yes gene_type:complete
MEKFTNKIRLIQEGKTIFYLCDEFDAEMDKIEEQKKKISNKYKENMLRMVILILESYIKVHNTQILNLSDYYTGDYFNEDTDDEDDYMEYDAIYVGAISVESITHNGGNEWEISGEVLDDRGNVSNNENYLHYLEAKELSQLLRGLLEIDPIMSCYGVEGVRNINK